MKKNMNRFFYLILVLIISIPLLSGCKEEDKSCKVIVTVKDIGDTSIRISGAEVKLSKENSFVQANGVTDLKGEAFFSFPNEAILDIDVTYTDEIGNVRHGKSTVRLRQGETERKDVLLQWE